MNDIDVTLSRTDIEWFKKNPTRRWRLRDVVSGEALVTGYIAEPAAGTVRAVVIAPRRAPDGIVVMKFGVTAPPQNDAADPWFLAENGVPQRISEVAAEFRRLTIDTDHTVTFTPPTCLAAFAAWAAKDVARLLRLFVYASAAYARHIGVVPEYLLEAAVDLRTMSRDDVLFQFAPHRAACPSCAAADDAYFDGAVRTAVWRAVFAEDWEGCGRLVVRPTQGATRRLASTAVPFDDALPVVLPRPAVAFDARDLGAVHTYEGEQLPVLLAGAQVSGEWLLLFGFRADGTTSDTRALRLAGSTWSSLYREAVDLSDDSYPYRTVLPAMVAALYLAVHHPKTDPPTAAASAPARSTPEVVAGQDGVSVLTVPETWIDAAFAAAPAAPPAQPAAAVPPPAPRDAAALVLAPTTQSAHTRRVRCGPGRLQTRLVTVAAKSVHRWMRRDDA